MKTKIWIWIIAALLVLCVAISAWVLWPKPPAEAVKVYSKGELLHTLPLNKDTQITVTTDLGTNVITVKDGKVAVTDATCPDHYCMQRGWCHSGTQIVCLPNRLVLEFTGEQTIDGVVG